jgi:hypothetical protein
MHHEQHAEYIQSGPEVAAMHTFGRFIIIIIIITY